MQPSTKAHNMKAVITHVMKPMKNVREYAEYAIQVIDVRGAWVAYKRYSEFRALREDFLDNYLCPSCVASIRENWIVKHFPRRKVFTSRTNKTLHERKHLLALFLETIVLAVQTCSDMECTSSTVMHDFLDIPGMKIPIIKLEEDIPMLSESKFQDIDTIRAADLTPVVGFSKKERRTYARKSSFTVKNQVLNLNKDHALRLRQQSITCAITTSAPPRKKMKITLATIEEVRPYLCTTI
ncbi:hypothetical protein THRCLA_20663 [Thraustotheca clavata]|uniref:PX domain-containing protein n=1 Tax=Thraustotheca clavata TaxID=74557 RepID=A0A1W0A4T0_9STRA|nr:hypothetical protein THRCLA_20663 [Thraustotheca clavata]